MEALDLLNLIAGGESSKVQLKENVSNTTSIAQEIAAFANTDGGTIIIGVNDKTGSITGLSFQDIQRINNLLSTAASDHVKSAIHIKTDSIEVEPGKRVIVVSVPEGHNKPHKDKDGLIFVKNGADKRKVTSNEELARMLQSSSNITAEEQVLHHANYADIDWERFETFYREKYEEPVAEEEQVQKFENLRLGNNGKPNLAGALLFTNAPQRTLTGLFTRAIWFPGKEREADNYLAAEQLSGTLPEQYQKGMDFILRAMHRIPSGDTFNSPAVPEIPKIVFEELLTNALIHRDYFIRDSIKLYIFQDRIEIISPGKLPNHLTVEQARRGIRKKRNDILDSLAPNLMTYKGAGSGILRALKAYPHIEFVNDAEAEQFTATIYRPALVRP